MRAMKLHVSLGAFYLPAWLDHLRFRSFVRRQNKRHRMRNGTQSSSPKPSRKRVAVVSPWFGKGISGGAETAAYGLVEAIQEYAPEMDIEVLSSTLPEFAQDWNTPTHPEGCREENGMVVRRFHTQSTDREFFDFINGHFLMPGGTDELRTEANNYRSPIPGCLESYYLMRMVYSPNLLRYIESEWDNYDAFAFIPYMFATTVMGCVVAGKKAILIPCLHDERYACMRVYRQVFQDVRTVLCHVRSEGSLFRRFYPKAPMPEPLGVQVQTDIPQGDEARFREKYDIRGPFILYAGRQVSGKNVPLLIEYFRSFRAQFPRGSELQLVLIGKGDLDYSQEPGVRALGFIPPEDKMDAYRAATALTMLSVNESFSIVMMEAWLQETPALVSSQCDVTRDHVLDSGGGATCGTAEEFCDALCQWLEHPNRANEQGSKGREYVLSNYTAKIIAERFRDALRA